ncbi:MAG: hypothetical protein EAZ97_11125 [Bacteroidetes bacterium]|nr:MAG: hypothetical protein EAZ97_11125 [Bacteroidota bacterium]
MKQLLPTPKFCYLLLTLIFIGFSGCNNDASFEEREVYKEKIMNQRMMLDDAIQQLKYEKKQVNLLKNQVSFNEKQVLTSAPAVSKKEVSEDYEGLRSQVEKWQTQLISKEKQYQKIKNDLDKTIDFLVANNIDVVRNKLGEIEKITIAEDKKQRVLVDSLLATLEYERSYASKSAQQFEKTLKMYRNEIRTMQEKFNNNGIFLKNHKSNFAIVLEADPSEKGKVRFKLGINREIGKPQEGDLKVKMVCKLPDGNYYEILNEQIDYDKKQTYLTVSQPMLMKLSVNGAHKVIVYLDEVEVYAKEMEFNQ